MIQQNKQPQVPQTPKVEPLHPMLDSKENSNKARVQQLAYKQYVQSHLIQFISKLLTDFP